MQKFPHLYRVRAQACAEGAASLEADGLPALTTASPKEFDGPGDQWSPESLLCAALAGCLILTFRAIARASRLEWRSLACEVQGTLEREEGVTQFTRFVTTARLEVPAGANVELCRRLLEKAERDCLIANSVKAPRELRAEIVASP
jgi:organic hydroperoxide reductase OsmC/OhrA